VRLDDRLTPLCPLCLFSLFSLACLLICYLCCHSCSRLLRARGMSMAALLRPRPSHQLTVRDTSKGERAFYRSFHSKQRWFRYFFNFLPSRTRAKKASGFPKQPMVITPKSQLKFQNTKYTLILFNHLLRTY